MRRVTVGEAQPGRVVGHHTGDTDVVEVADHGVEPHRVVDHRRYGAERGEGQEVDQRLEPLPHHDAHRLAGPCAVGVVPGGVPVAQRREVGQAVAAQHHPAAVVVVVAVHERHPAIGVGLQGVLQEVPRAEVRLGHQ
ncbi:hypothetical protein GCM10017559_54860 [Streptosporangium longisporum]|uniref:Uncharacterized protein n=1 Tax=Streptosporangium longisporum TaxID=46187 RepID=A0ABP6KVS8_9ACTN